MPQEKPVVQQMYNLIKCLILQIAMRCVAARLRAAKIVTTGGRRYITKFFSQKSN